MKFSYPFLYSSVDSMEHNYLGASLAQVLDIAGLSDDYTRFLKMFAEAKTQFSLGNNRAGCDVLYKIWMDPRIIPALLLCECFYARKLVVPDWAGPWKIYSSELKKPSGGTRPIAIPNLGVRIQMGVVNKLLQASTDSWDKKTTGFRPGVSTQMAMDMLYQKALAAYRQENILTLAQFDIKGAFNHVNVQDLFNQLELNCLPRKIKLLIWEWQNVPTLAQMQGLKQGFSYSPTLFAWYMDHILVKHSPFFAYADNLAGVFQSPDEAWSAVDSAANVLNHYGLFLNNRSVTFLTAKKSDSKNMHKFKWLGHTLVLPDLKVKYNTTKPLVTGVKPLIITPDKWKVMLRETQWLDFVLDIDWR